MYSQECNLPLWLIWQTKTHVDVATVHVILLNNWLILNRVMKDRTDA